MNVERTEEELSWVGLAVAGTLRVAELAVIALGVLIFCPPLLILVALVVLPSLALGIVVSLFALPVLLVRHFHRQRAEHAHRRIVARAGAKLGTAGRALGLSR